MKAFIAAAGLGSRLRPLTLTTPKPLIEVKGKPLLFWHLQKLHQAGIKELVINVSWLRQQIIEFVENQPFHNLQIHISDEQDSPLDTGGGIKKALPLLGDEPFLSINADIFTDFDYAKLQPPTTSDLLNLLLVNNPEHNPQGDFSINNNRLLPKNQHTYTYSGIACYHPKLFAEQPLNRVFSVTKLINQAIASKQAAAQIHQGQWNDIGTIKRLNACNQQGFIRLGSK